MYTIDYKYYLLYLSGRCNIVKFDLYVYVSTRCFLLIIGKLIAGVCAPASCHVRVEVATSLAVPL